MRRAIFFTILISSYVFSEGITINTNVISRNNELNESLKEKESNKKRDYTSPTIPQISYRPLNPLDILLKYPLYEGKSPEIISLYELRLIKHGYSLGDAQKISSEHKKLNDLFTEGKEREYLNYYSSVSPVIKIYQPIELDKISDANLMSATEIAITSSLMYSDLGENFIISGYIIQLLKVPPNRMTPTQKQVLLKLIERLGGINYLLAQSGKTDRLGENYLCQIKSDYQESKKRPEKVSEDKQGTHRTFMQDLKNKATYEVVMKNLEQLGLSTNDIICSSGEYLTPFQPEKDKVSLQELENELSYDTENEYIETLKLNYLDRDEDKATCITTLEDLTKLKDLTCNVGEIMSHVFNQARRNETKKKELDSSYVLLEKTFNPEKFSILKGLPISPLFEESDKKEDSDCYLWMFTDIEHDLMITQVIIDHNKPNGKKMSYIITFDDGTYKTLHEYWSNLSGHYYGNLGSENEN